MTMSERMTRRRRRTVAVNATAVTAIALAIAVAMLLPARILARGGDGQGHGAKKVLSPGAAEDSGSMDVTSSQEAVVNALDTEKNAMEVAKKLELQAAQVCLFFSIVFLPILLLVCISACFTVLT